MTQPNANITAAFEKYCVDLRRIHASGGGTGERSNCAPLNNLLNAVGETLRPKVFCVGELADQGAGHPDFGLYAARQIQKRQPRQGQTPERGVVEVKPLDDDAWITSESDQVSRYWERYRLVLVTNLRDFVLIGENDAGRPVKLETFSLATDVEDFRRKLAKPRVFTRESGTSLGEYLARTLSHRAALAEPRDVAWLLASYARDALSRVEEAEDTGSLEAVRSALEDTLGVHFSEEGGLRFFHSTLVQTLFYGTFAAWVLWARQKPSPTGKFDWRTAVWHLSTPVVAALFQQLAQPGRLQPLGLVEVLDWTAAALDRVDRASFFSRFNEGEAVGYFYEPFLEAFDPVLRKQLGVWYTPMEVVRYMVARVDKALKNDLGISEGLAANNVYILDPCCGTGAYLVEVLHRIATNLHSQGHGALLGARLRHAATKRMFGFEIMLAPFVIAHLQLELTLRRLDASLPDAAEERVGVYLTNALTGWQPREHKPVLFPELQDERKRAEQVKQEAPILVILGNPPYNGFADMAVDEERELSTAYRTVETAPRPEGKGLNDQYVRFFRMAERRIAEKERQGVVCFISNYSWLDGLSFTGMRERYMQVFDVLRIDCLNGDSRKTGKVAPDGSPDPSIFSTKSNPEGIQVGTAVTTLIRKPHHKPPQEVHLRHLWGRSKREELIATKEVEPDTLYQSIRPPLQLGLPFLPAAVSLEWFEWPTLPELFPTSFPGVTTSRDPFLVDIDFDRLRTRVTNYFDSDLSNEEIKRRYPQIMKSVSRFDAPTVRNQLLNRGGPDTANFVRYTYRPFDNRWLYWEKDTKLLDEKREEFKPHVFEGNIWLSAARHLRKGEAEPQACVARHISSYHLIERGANLFPAWLREDLGAEDEEERRPNLSGAAHRYLDGIGADVEDLFHHILVVLHDPEYLSTNSGGLRMGWPRIPLPGWPDGRDENAVRDFARLAVRGRELAALLDPESPVKGVTHAPLRPDMVHIAVPATIDGRNMEDADFELNARWGSIQKNNKVMPGEGRVVERECASDERSAMKEAIPVLGETAVDVFLNSNALWRNVPVAVWDYKLGGYQVLKKWLSYREREILGRPITPDEVQYFSETARRIAAILICSSNG